ncbi:putative triose phosphate/phosphoenolpyruvate translocator, sugar phosphate transporter [Helianthus annuus]|uniref:Putative triose phosphate/phosphoenolpyruvate translocator n=1 Tax=Helianthus annuus TaxID=4232 RepID=A0A251SUD2_HELAN|nr:xylulose 5-phosphate/phosphate translocator, chloroplastic [Helianthus annuus]KAF5774330.1 putative triose phosphate/phosphoenolpyruvate translocator, sugar phosphate transporter [Helianthus annuus]KAJ0482242.1 putative triose phosphate/phosphoenolpyruvate translocator, sugar phosphate transporter [Helianthus annuus]KAJ0850146.1 putative triose phosphate/phosphoenolpyruvate translocator, sugar phosphate transporter [Helianthus annuus]KAJ0859195.1 putative triose phosphate/phosphoenolpyruvate
MMLLNILPSSSSLSFSKTHKKYPIKNPNFTHLGSRPTISHHQNPKVSTFNNIHTHPTHKVSSFFKIPHGFSNFDPNHEKPTSYTVKSVSESNQDSTPDGEIEKDSNKSNKTLQLAIVFGFWYFQNIVFNIYNKKALNVFPYPWLLASFQLLVGSVWMLVLWSTKLQPCPKIDKSFIVALLGPALFHTIGHISACVSFSKVAVSFTHVIKSAEPVFSVVFSSALGDSYPLSVWLSILPIVMGCSLAAVTEVSFNLGGLWGAMISNVGFVLRNIYSKKSLQNFKQVNGLNLYGWITILSFVYLFPVAVFVEGSQWVAGYHKAIATVGKPSTFYLWVMISGVFYHLYNQSSYQALDDISPLTFSVGNTMKRVVVIVSSVIVFRNPVRPLNALGSAIAILGTFLYSQASSKKKAAVEKKD